MWVHKSTIAIGGLENIGYAPNKDILIVLSTQGQGLFDCKKGEIIARLRDDMNWWNKFDQYNNSITGFDVLEGITIHTSGLYGGDTLAKVTFDNWTLIATEPEPDDKPFENYTVKRIYLVSPDNSTLHCFLFLRAS